MELALLIVGLLAIGFILGWLFTTHRHAKYYTSLTKNYRIVFVPKEGDASDVLNEYYKSLLEYEADPKARTFLSVIRGGKDKL